MLKKIVLKGEQKKVLFLPATNPIQIKGVAGSGKTTVALYRAKHLIETHGNLFKEAKVVIFTYNKTLAAYIRVLRPYINGGYQKDTDEIKAKTPDGLNVDIVNFHSWAYRFVGLEYGQTVMQWEQINIIDAIKIKKKASVSHKILDKSSEFFQEEISWIKGKLFKNKEDYISAKRTGRGTSDRVTQDDKQIIWDVYQSYEANLSSKNKVDFDDYAILALKKIETNSDYEPPFTHIIIDEAQDLNKAQILTISKLVSPETNSISIIADAAQRIFKSGFTWSEVGINVRGGRTIEFKKNYRNSVQIARAALSLLDKEPDKSEFTEVKTALAGGEKPTIGYFKNYQSQLSYLYKSINELPEKMGVVVLHRNHEGVRNLKSSLETNGFSIELVKTNAPVNYGSDSIKICTMSSIKGLEFNHVFIIDLNDNIIPYPQGFIEENDEFHVSTERRLLYTCMTRAKNSLYLLSSNSTAPSRYLSEISEDLVKVIPAT